MSRDINADRRYEIDQAIRFKEDEMDEIFQEKRAFDQDLEDFQARLHQRFQESSSLYEKMARSGHHKGESEMLREYELEGEINRMLEAHSSEMEYQVRQKQADCDTEIERLYQEKAALPWD